MNRKKVIRGLAAVVISSLGLLVMMPAAVAQSRISAEELGGGLHLIKGAGGNVLVLESSSGLVLVDGGNAQATERLSDFLDNRFEDAEIPVLFNTHWHLDQTGSNEWLARSEAKIIAHENTKLWMGTEIISKWEDVVYFPRSAKALPNNTFYYGAHSMTLGNSEIEYGYLPQAHTDGDIYVYFPEQNVVAGGGVISGGELPAFDYSTGGWIGGMVNALRTLVALGNEDTVYVPASGELRSRADLEAQIALCVAIIEAMGTHYYASGTYEEFIASDPLQNVGDNWTGDVDLFLHTAYEGSWGHVGELRRFR